jgi:DnaJ-class molecular chaperone
MQRCSGGTESRLNVDECYSELGLTAQASDAEVKAAWRRLAARWHPDRNGSAQALRKIQRINRAMEEIRRVRGLAMTMPAPLDEEPEAAAAGAPLEHTVELTLEEAAAGCARIVEGEIATPCGLCSGRGVARQAVRCDACEGRGTLRPHLWFSWMSTGTKCRACDGSGALRPACAKCQGTGQSTRRYRCRVQIPPGLRSGDVVHASMRGQGGEALALLLRIELRPHPLFALERDGTVRCELPVDGFAWIAGRWIEVPTPGGPQQMRLQRDHRVYRIRGQGFPVAQDGARADCIVTVDPLFPQEWGKDQEALLERLIAANTRKRGTPAGERIAAWDAAVRRWKDGLGQAPGS